MVRSLLCGLSLIVIQASTTMAQTLASAMDTPVAVAPLVVDNATRLTSAVPEIVRRTPAPPAAEPTDVPAIPAAVQTQPDADPQFLYAIRLNP